MTAPKKKLEPAEDAKPEAAATAHLPNEETPSAEAEKEKEKGPAALVTLLQCNQIMDPGTKVILRQNQAIPVPEVSKWVEKQEKHGLLRIRRL